MPTSPIADRDALVASFCQVAEQSFFAFAEAVVPAPDEVAAYDSWIEALVHFSGPTRGQLVLAVPASLGVELCGAFLGSGPDEVPDSFAVDDLVGELANMAVGAWLTNVCPADCFALSHPAVRRAEAGPACPETWMACNGQPVAMTVTEE